MAALNCCRFFVLAKLIRLREVNPLLRVVRNMLYPLYPWYTCHWQVYQGLCKIRSALADPYSVQF